MNSINVFLIDDDKMFNFIHSQILKSVNLDLTVKMYQEAATALEELEGIMPKDDSRYIVFVDINMPGVDGWGFLDGLMEFPGAIRDLCEVFMLSSSNDKTDVEKARTYSIVRGYISKPLTSQQVQSIYKKEYASLLTEYKR